jgi:regulator of sigma E protease
MQLMSGVTLGDQENGIPVVIQRADTNKTETITLKPKRQQGGLAMIGVSGPQSLVLSPRQATIEHSPAADARLISPAVNELKVGEPKLEGGDKVVRVGDQPVKSYREFAAILAQQADKPLQVTVERPIKQGRLDTNVEAGAAHNSIELTFEVPARPMRDFGLSMKMGPISAVQEGSPAASAGLKVDDVITAVDGKPPGEPGGWTPDTLPDLMRRAAAEKREVEIAVERGGKEGAAPEQVTIKVTPRAPSMYYSAIPLGAAQGIEALGIAYRVTNEVQTVVPGTPAAASDIKPGDRVTGAKVALPKDENGKTPKPVPIKLTDEAENWVAVVDNVQYAPPGTTVTFTVTGPKSDEERDVTLTPAVVPDAFTAPRGFGFEPIKRTRTAATVADAVRYGWDETTEALTMVVRFLKKLGTQVPLTMLGGPGTIAAAAGGAASEGISSLLVFLTMLSANLAVINFLPIPLLDGGHMVFLAYEGLRGRPANERVVVALHTAGFVFIISLMLFVIGLDIQRWVFT